MQTVEMNTSDDNLGVIRTEGGNSNHYNIVPNEGVEIAYEGAKSSNVATYLLGGVKCSHLVNPTNIPEKFYYFKRNEKFAYEKLDSSDNDYVKKGITGEKVDEFLETVNSVMKNGE